MMSSLYDNLPKIEAITLPTGRTYQTPDGAYPSITTVLGKTSPSNIWLQKWKDKVGVEEAARISKIATDRGTLVHTYLERYWNKESVLDDLLKEAPDTQRMVNSLIRVTKNNITSVYAQEIAVWSPTLRVAGRVDKFCEWQRVPACADYKTSKKVKSDTKDYKLQITFYILAHNELIQDLKINKGLIIIAVEGSDTPQIIEFDHRPYVPELLYRINTYYKNYHDISN